jgi:hypothetical protein
MPVSCGITFIAAIAESETCSAIRTTSSGGCDFLFTRTSAEEQEDLLLREPSVLETRPTIPLVLQHWFV